MAKILDGSLPNTAAYAPGTVDAQGLVELCRLIEVPVGLAISATPPASGQGEEDRALKADMLELNRAFSRIRDPRVRQTLLNLVKAAAPRD